jgi:hypothetical protein
MSEQIVVIDPTIPTYRLLSDRFFEPEVVGKGSIIEYDGVPDHEMEPLNDAAEARLSAWYEEEFLLLDDDKRKPVLDHKGEKQFHQPRLDLKPREQRPDAARPAGIRVVATPTVAETHANATVAAMEYAPAKEWTRPAPESEAAQGIKIKKAEAPNKTTSDGAPITAQAKVPA